MYSEIGLLSGGVAPILFSEYNFLIFIVEDVTNTEDVYHDASYAFVTSEVLAFKWGITGMTAALNLNLVIVMIGLIKFYIVTPIV